MTNVIYADVLVVINTYVTYLLLVLTSVFSKEKMNRIRMVASAVLGGCSSLLILIPEISDTVLSFSRVLLAAAFIFIAFGKVSLRRYLRLYVIFFLLSFIFAGMMLAMWYFTSPGFMYYSSGIVYFAIDSLTLIVLTAICYCIIRAASYFMKFKSPSGRIYFVDIFVEGFRFKCRAFLDTGNMLSDPFTGMPVIIACFDKLKPLFDEKDNLKSTIVKIYFVPCTTVAGNDVLPCFHPEKVSVRGVEGSFETDSVIVAVTKKKIKNGEYDALLCDGIFENKTIEEGGHNADIFCKNYTNTENEVQRGDLRT